MSNQNRDPELSASERRWLDRMLSEAPPIEPSAALRRAVAEIPLRHPREPAAAARGVLAAWPSYAFRFALLAAIVSLAMGAWLGYQASVLPEVVLIDDGSAPNADEEWDELVELAFADRLDGELEP